MTYTVVIPAAGQGKRMQAGKNKQFLQLKDCPVIIHTLRVFEEDTRCEGIVVVVNEHEVNEMKRLFSDYNLQKIREVVVGGKERQDSVYEGIKTLSDPDSVVFIHDGARPFVRHEELHRLLTYVSAEEGAVLAVQVTDTIKRVTNGIIQETVPRQPLWAVQTPQAFMLKTIKRAYDYAFSEQYAGTDDASLVEYMGGKVRIVPSSEENIKLTTPYDIEIANVLLERRKEEANDEDRTRI